MRFLVACAALAIAAPAVASTVFTFEPGESVGLGLAGPKSGYRYSVTIQGGNFVYGDPIVEWYRDITYGYNGGLGYIEYNDTIEGASCNSVFGCSSLGQFTKLVGTSRSFQVKNLPGYDTCSDKSPLYTTCAYYTDSNLGSVSVYAEALEGSGRVTVTISDQTAVPEPGTWTLMLVGLGGVGAMARSRRSFRGWRRGLATIG